MYLKRKFQSIYFECNHYSFLFLSVTTYKRISWFLFTHSNCRSTASSVFISFVRFNWFRKVEVKVCYVGNMYSHCRANDIRVRKIKECNYKTKRTSFVVTPWVRWFWQQKLYRSLKRSQCPACFFKTNLFVLLADGKLEINVVLVNRHLAVA